MKKYLISCFIVFIFFISGSALSAKNTQQSTDTDQLINEVITKYIDSWISKEGIILKLKEFTVKLTQITKDKQQDKLTKKLAHAYIRSIHKAIIRIQKDTTIPSMGNTGALENYLKRSRDVFRIASLKDISTALGAYYADKEVYPATLSSGCINTNEITRNYMPRGVPTDPIKGRLTPGCDGTGGMTFAYRSGKTPQWVPYYIIGVELENETWGNSSDRIDNINSQSQLVQWSGKYFYIIN